jgi:hypothetical protein
MWMVTEWYYRTSTDRAEGPVTAAHLKQLVQLGEIGPETEIRKGAEGRWITANKVKGLLDAAPLKPTATKTALPSWMQPQDGNDRPEPARTRSKSPAPLVRRPPADADQDEEDRPVPVRRTTPSDVVDAEYTVTSPAKLRSPLLLVGAGVGGVLVVGIVMALMLSGQSGERGNGSGASGLTNQQKQLQLAEEQRRKDNQQGAAKEEKERAAKEEADKKAKEIEQQKYEAWLRSGKEIGQFVGTEDSSFAGFKTSNGIAISSRNKYVAAVSNSKSAGGVTSAIDPMKGYGDTAVYLWNMKDGTQLHRFDPKPHMYPITHSWTSVAFSGNEKLVAAGREDGTIHVWDTATGREVAMLLTPSKTVSSYTSFGQIDTISFSQDGTTIVGAGADSSGDKRTYPVWVWSVATKQIVSTLSGHSDIVIASDISRDGRLAVTGSWDRTAVIWDLRSGREHRLLDAHAKWVTAVAFSPDGKGVLTGSNDQTVRFWDVASGHQVFSVNVNNAVNSVSFRTEGKYALVGTSMRPDSYLGSPIESNPAMIDIDKGAVAKLPVAFMKTPLESVNAAVSLDGKYVVFTAKQRTRIRGRDVEASYLTLRELPE